MLKFFLRTAAALIALMLIFFGIFALQARRVRIEVAELRAVAKKGASIVSILEQHSEYANPLQLLNRSNGETCASFQRDLGGITIYAAPQFRANPAASKDHFDTIKEALEAFVPSYPACALISLNYRKSFPHHITFQAEVDGRLQLLTDARINSFD